MVGERSEEEEGKKEENTAEKEWGVARPGLGRRDHSRRILPKIDEFGHERRAGFMVRVKKIVTNEQS